MENLFLYWDKTPPPDHFLHFSETQWQKLSSSTIPNKNLEKLKNCTWIIQQVDPDILFLNEIGGKESLDHFNDFFLNNQYQPFLIEGNSDRGIDVAYLVHRRVKAHFVHITHKDKPLSLKLSDEKNQKNYYMSRDISELRLFKDQNSPPLLVLLNVHLKSKLDQDHIDPEGKLRRKAECELLCKIYRDLEAELPSHCPIIMGGDFNGDANPKQLDSEFQSLLHLSAQEAFDYLNLPLENRFTKVYSSRNIGLQHLQLDYFWLSPQAAQGLLSASVFTYKKTKTLHSKDRISLFERSSLPSDHFPIIMEIQVPFYCFAY